MVSFETCLRDLRVILMIMPLVEGMVKNGFEISKGKVLVQKSSCPKYQTSVDEDALLAYRKFENRKIVTAFSVSNLS